MTHRCEAYLYCQGCSFITACLLMCSACTEHAQHLPMLYLPCIRRFARVQLQNTNTFTCRDSASSLLHRAAHYIHARRVASELEGQAASWQLLQHLYCTGYTPAGDNVSGAADVGGLQTYREQAAGLVNDSTDLRRCAQPAGTPALKASTVLNLCHRFL